MKHLAFLMQFKYTLNILLFGLLAIFALVSGDTEEENQLVIKAEKAFSEKDFVTSTSLFSQLLSSYPKNTTYNYKYGASLLYSSPDKANALKYLQYAVTNNERDSLSLFYLAKAYHINFYFDDAIDYYQKFNNKVPAKYRSEYEINDLITQCKFAKEIIENIQLIKVLERKTVKVDDFFRTYRLGSLERKIIIVPDEFRSAKDKKIQHQSLIVHNPNNDEIYFSSYGKKGDKGKDIYKVTRFPNGNYSEPINLGMNINTSADEDYPYLHPSGKILYFASKGHNSIGGYDIFRSELNESTNTWGKAENLGFTINSPDDDFLYVSDRQEDIAYFSSTRNNKLGELTLFKILPQQGNNAVILVQGTVKTKNGIIPSNPIVIKNLQTGELIGEFQPNPKSGDFIATLPHLYKYSLEINHIGETTRSELALPNANQNKMVAHDILIDDVTGTIEISENRMPKVKKEDVAVVYRRAARMENLYGKDVEFDNPKALAQVREEVNLPPRDITAGFKKDDSKFKKDDSKNNELNEIRKQQEQLNSQINAAYAIAANEQKKSETLQYHKTELEKKLTTVKTESEKEKIEDEIDAVQNKISVANKESVKAIKIAKQKEHLVEKSVQQEKITEKYLKALENAENSGNSNQAIAELEKVMKDLDKAKAEFKTQEVVVNKIFEKDLEQKRAELIQQDFKVNKLEMQLEALEEERISIENQMIQTKNKALLDELKLQQKELNVKITETNTELKKVQMIKALFVSEVASLESGELVAEEELIANLMENNYTESEKKAFTQELDEVKANRETAAFKEGKTEEFVKEENKNQEVAKINSSSKPNTSDNSLQNKSEDNSAVSPKVESFQRYAEEAEKELARLQAIQNQKTELQNSMNNRGVSSVEVAQKLQALNEEEKQVNARLQKIQAAFVAPQNLSSDEQKAFAEIEEKQLQAQQNRIQTKLDIHKNFVENIEGKMLVNEELASGEGIFVHAEMKDKLTEIEKINNQKQNSVEDKNTVNNRVLALQNEIDVLQTEMMNIVANHEKHSVKNTVATAQPNLENSAVNQQQSVASNEIIENKTTNIDENTEKFNPENPSKASLSKANQSLGTDLNLDFNYGISPDVKRNLQEAEKLNILAAKKYYEADSLKNTLGLNTKKDKKTKKRINKLLSEAKNEQLAIQESYAKVNASEHANLVNQVQYSIDEGFVANKYLDSAVSIQKSSVNKMAQAKEIRQASAKAKNVDEKQKLNNQAYQLEIQALALQNIVVQGDLDESKPKEDKASYVVNTKSANPESNVYNEKAAEFRAKAQTEKNPTERMRLMNLARQYELAGDEEKTKRSINENNILKNEFEVKKDFVEAAQQNTKQNTTANKGFELEKESERIFAQANDLMQKSVEETDKIKEIEWINQAKELYTLANNKQNEAIQTYQQSAKEPENPSVKLAFEKKTIKKSTTSEPEIAQKTTVVAPKSNQKVAELPMETMDESPEEIMKAYTSVLEEAKAIEKNEANRIDEIKRLLEEARRKNLAYEKMLADMQNIKDDKVLDQKFAEANVLREEAEKLELQAKKEEEYLKNNMAEAQSKRMEASLIQQAMDEQTKVLAQQKDKESQAELNKINDFAGANNNQSIAANTSQKSTANSNVAPKSNTEKPNTVAPKNNAVNAKENSAKVLEDYQRKLNEVANIEQKEVERLDRLMTLRNQSNKKKQEYETILQQVDKMTDATQIQTQITKADKLREEAEKLDVEIKNEEEIMRNNLAESKSKRQEAAFLLDVMDNETKSQALAQDKKILDNKEKLDNYMAKQTVVLASNKNNTTNNTNVNNKKPIDSNTKTSFTDIKTKESQIVMEDKGILGGYTEDELKINEGFTLNGPSSKQILLDPPMPPGLFFKVQVGAFKNKIDPAVFQGITPINGESTSFGVIRYTAGLFRGYKAANMAKGRIRNIGFRDAFVVAFYNGKRITLAEAQLLLDQANESEKLVYESVIADEVNKLKALGIKESEADAVTLINQRESMAVRTPNANDNRIVNSTIGTNGTSTKNSSSALYNSSNSQSSLAQTSISLNSRNDLFYTVQIGAFGAPRTSQQLYNIDPLYSYVTERGLIKYSTGVYTNYFEANQRKKEVVEIGPKDAYVVAYQNGQTVAVQSVRPITDANLNTNSNENSASTSPSNSTNSTVSQNNTINNEVVFRVQVGAYKAPINPKTTPLIKELEIYGVQYTTTSTGLLIYTIGNVKTKAEADELNVKVKEVGIKDAYVVAFKDGKRISIQEALNLNK